MHPSTHSPRHVSAARTDLAASLPIERALTEFKALMVLSDRAALRNHGTVPDELAAKARDHFAELCLLLNRTIGGTTIEGEAIAEEVGRQVQREVLPYILLTEIAERIYSKPRGYAGDFYTIEKLYQDQAGGMGRLGALVDRCFLDQPAARAVRNRRRLLAEEIHAVITQEQGLPAEVTSLACGPARELFDPCKALMDHVLEWRLIHRTEADMDRLFRASAFGRPSTRIRFEEQRINLFAECVKEGGVPRHHHGVPSRRAPTADLAPS